MRDDDFIAQLEACTLPADRFHHADHLHAAWLYLTRFSATEAIAKFSEALRRYAISLGKADRYHETITWAYLLLLNERMRHPEPAMSWGQFAAAHPDLFDWKNSILLRYYRPETLRSDLARRFFLMPDRLRLDAALEQHLCSAGG
jgi:hypothetical protein